MSPPLSTELMTAVQVNGKGYLSNPVTSRNLKPDCSGASLVFQKFRYLKTLEKISWPPRSFSNCWRGYAAYGSISIKSLCTAAACSSKGSRTRETTGTMFQNSPTAERVSLKYSERPLKITPATTHSFPEPRNV